MCSYTRKRIEKWRNNWSNVTVKSFTPGSIVFNARGTDDKIWTEPLNTLKFKSKVDRETKVNYAV